LVFDSRFDRNMLEHTCITPGLKATGRRFVKQNTHLLIDSMRE
jgi:hypothetical protein